MNHCGACLLLFSVRFGVALSSTAQYFTAAVYEHAHRNNISADPTEVLIFKNLAYYKKAMEVAKLKGADIIIFPEYGIFPPLDRHQVKPYLEMIPNPKEMKINPCNEIEQYQNHRILYSLSCMAKEYKIVVVANMGDIKPCKGQTGCPENGAYYFNTNVVFDRDGTLLFRYYKEHLFYEFGMDVPPPQQDPIFKTEFGTFATFISFDIQFERMSAIAQSKEIDAFAFSSMWVNIPPQMTSVQQWAAWSLGNNATLLGANIHIPGYYTVGSGIFTGTDGPLAYTFDPDGASKLIIARVPKRGYPSTSFSPYASITAITLNGIQESFNDGLNVPTECSRKVLGEAEIIHKHNRCVELNMTNHAFIKLIEDRDNFKACINGICCSLKYSAKNMTENFYLVVYNGITDFFIRYSFCEQTCMLVRCEADGKNPCATFPLKSKTLFYNVQLKADFSTKHIYPSVISSGMRLTSLKDWSYGVQEISSDTYEGHIDFKSSSGQSLTFAGLRGRCYDQDPPYIR